MTISNLRRVRMKQRVFIEDEYAEFITERFPFQIESGLFRN